MKIQCDCGEWFEDSFIAEWGGFCSTCKAKADLKANKDGGDAVPCTGVLCDIEQASQDYNDDMDRFAAKHKHKDKPISERERERLINKSCGD